MKPENNMIGKVKKLQEGTVHSHFYCSQLKLGRSTFTGTGDQKKQKS